jgi:diadenosine tetraphosphate (Ap4A) HIT family hydrolase
MKRTWPHDWQARRAGQDCPKCREGRPDADEWGVRFLAGQWADAYLERRPPQPGTAVVVFRGTRHVADPCDFTDDELTGYWADVRTTAKAIEHAYQPCQLNYATLGNAVPHVHTHITPRYPDDPAPGRPLPDWVFASASELTPAELSTQVKNLQRHVAAVAAVPDPHRPGPE